MAPRHRERRLRRFAAPRRRDPSAGSVTRRAQCAVKLLGSVATARFAQLERFRRATEDRPAPGLDRHGPRAQRIERAGAPNAFENTLLERIGRVVGH